MGSEHFLLPPRDHPREGALAREPEVLALKLIQCPVMRRGRKMVLLLSPCMWAPRQVPYTCRRSGDQPQWLC